MYVVSLKDGTNAECCNNFDLVYHQCEKSINRCQSEICKDGTVRTWYCGYGPCNIFGCDCNGGCRDNSMGSWNEATRLFKEKNPHLHY